MLMIAGCKVKKDIVYVYFYRFAQKSKLEIADSGNPVDRG